MKKVFLLLIIITLTVKFSYAQSEWKEIHHTNSIKDKSFEWVIRYNEKTSEVQGQVTTISNEDDNGNVVNITKPDFISGIIRCAGSASPFDCIEALIDIAISDCASKMSCTHCWMMKACQQ